MDFETLFIIVIILSMFFYYVMTQNCGNAGKETFSQIKNISVKNNTLRHHNSNTQNKIKEGFQNQQTDNNNLMNDNNAVLMFFYSKTCPHCIDFIPTWEKLKKMKTPGIEFKSIEGDSDDNDDFIKYNIKYLPTIILQFEGKQDFNVYKGDRSIDDIIKFVRLDGINLNTTVLEGFENNDNSENKDYICNNDENFEKGIFKLENNKFILEMLKKEKDKNGKMVEVYEPILEINADTEEDSNPVYSLVSKFIDELRNENTYNMSDEEIAYELSKCNIKKFLKNIEYGLCYNNTIEKLKNLYKNSESDMIKLNLLDKKVCSNDNYIIKKSYDPTSTGS
jgi:thiol-disulfide isomerase/thioredoxin